MLREKQQELIKKLRKAKTPAEEDKIKKEIDLLEEEIFRINY
ncbi:MAG: hypothetical protein UT43_C0017G0014 [Parcubacteria group bacterium GW2011_GWC1_39_29]|uniref:Uncharacterized protein n=1 Tax=Candidatus Yanofskybacteria bacterium GW2011_GWD1_39_16 TaxID=1619030 RepID=A0A837HQ66_9BACT|nr:MAG: hypothetical protein UT35_C0002G0013 [Candidatus Yanofskybacteria bacterium GW2011_GWD1_39_16]KKR14743.1 MAG: hypothetical protein UT43_C0017G0014 [Parcubacteria group bacterium GW2011_GWC1_39_29]